MKAIQLVLDQKVYKADKDEIKEFTVCELTSYDDGKLGVMLLPGKDRVIADKNAKNLLNRYFFTEKEAQDKQAKIRQRIVNIAVSNLKRSEKNCQEIMQKYGKK